MKLLTIGFFAFFFPLSLAAQLHQREFVCLQDGRKVFGVILEERPGTLVRIQTEGYRVLSIPFEDIDTLACSYGQKGYWQAIYLKKGGVLRGIVLDRTAHAFHLESYREVLFELEVEEIEKIVLEQVPRGDEEAFDLSRQAEKARRRWERKNNPEIPGRLRHLQEYGGWWGQGSNGISYGGLLISQIVSLQVSSGYSLGLGAQLQPVFRSGNSNLYPFAVLLDNRFYFPYPNNLVAYCFLDAGYFLNWPGPFLQPGAGIRFHVKKTTLNFSLGAQLLKYHDGLDAFPQGEPFWLPSLQFKFVID